MFYSSEEAVFCAGFSPHLPYLAAAAGSAGAVSVWDVLSEDAVRQSRHGPLLERHEAPLPAATHPKSAEIVAFFVFVA